ncbi:Gamma-tubulin complex component [Hirschfeldia incana]|nr:Gamma-tubulin complex component [Hirschfeldia incana]
MESLLRADSMGFETLIPAAMCSRRVSTHSTPPSVSVTELDLVRGLLQAMQGLSSPFIIWDQTEQTFLAKTTEMIRVSHLSRASLHALLAPFLYAATCLKLVESIVAGVNNNNSPSFTLIAFSNSVSAWLQRLRDIALNEEVKINTSNVTFTPTLLALTSSLSSLCSGAEYLLQVVRGAIPRAYFESSSTISTAEVAVHLLDYLYKKLDQVCLVQGGEVEEFHMLLQIFAASLLPYIEGLDSWLFEGTLDDPFGELFFTANESVSVHDAGFWEKSHMLMRVPGPKSSVSSLNEKKGVSGNDPSSLSDRDKEQKTRVLCPLFIKDLCKSIVSAGKSLQLMQHIPSASSETSGCGTLLAKKNNVRSTADLSLSEIFCLTLAGLIGHGDHVSRYLWKDEADEWEISPALSSYISGELENGMVNKDLPVLTCSERLWYKFLVGDVQERRAMVAKSLHESACYVTGVKDEEDGLTVKKALQGLFCHENPVVSVSKMDLERNTNAWNVLNLSHNYCLPSLNDESLLSAVFEGSGVADDGLIGTNYKFGFQSEYLSSQDDAGILETLFPFPTLLPSVQPKLRMSELLPYQKNSTLLSRVLSWMLKAEPMDTPLPVVIMQECFTIYIRRQVDYIGKSILSKLMNEWKLMHELAVLRAIYLLGSGDLLQHFLTVIFDRLGKGELSDDDFELNIILQESIRNSADAMLLNSSDSLVVSISREGCLDKDTDGKGDVLPLSSTRKSRGNNFGIDCLESLKFTYKVPWPLELIANTETIKKYNQVMGFLLKVKRAKYVLDKARRWMWKGKGSATKIRKNHWLLEQKLLNFVDAFHQYVMDRVYHTAWRELCEGMVKAGSLDEVIYIHETYLLSIQRQCFVVQEKLWAIIATRINMILGLALEFYSIQQTLNSGGAASAIKARCEMGIDRIEKQFEDCIAFLLRVLSSKLNVGHFPHLADLVTRINYNYHYMPDTGSVKTASGAETKSSRTWSAKSDVDSSDRFERPIMFALSKVLRRTQRLRLGACTTALHSNEIPSGEKSFSSLLKSHSFAHDQLEPLPRVYHMSSMNNRLLSSSAGTKSDQEEDDDLEDGFSELENSKSGQESSSSSSDDDSEVDEGKLSADEDDDDVEDELELDLTETDDSSSRKTVEKKQSELFKAIVSAGGLSVGSALDKWVEEEGNEINRTEVAKAMLQLRRRRMYGRALQMSDWLEANKKIEMNERDYASRLDLIVKTRGLEKGEAYVEKIPKSFRGEVMYRTLLANCVVACNVKKSELVFNRMKDLGFPRSGFTCDQMLLLYKRVDRKKIADVLLLMEKEDVKPSLLTYKILIDVKGSSNDIKGMEQVVETMRDEGVEPDFNTQAIIARHYTGAGLKEKAESVLKEMEGERLEANRRAFKDLLSIYASLGREDEVRRIWKICESKPRFEESLSAIHAFGKLNKVQEAEEIFEKIIKMDRRASSNTYSVLLRVYVDHKMLSKGKDLVKRMAESGCRIEASTWDALIKLYVEAGEVEKADSLLSKASKQSHTKLMMSSFMYIMDEYAKRGDVHNSEKIFLKMREVGYTSRLRQFQALLQAYLNAKAPAYGMRDRMKADNIFPNKAMAAQLAQGDPFKKTSISDILD